MQLHPGFIDEYKKRHDELWPELKALLKESGISDYSIFLDPSTLELTGNDFFTASAGPTQLEVQWGANGCGARRTQVQVVQDLQKELGINQQG